MILKVEKIGLSLEVDDELLNSLVEKGKSHFPNEFGGFLVGYYSDDNRKIQITNTILPKTFKSSKFSFERNTKGIEKKLGAYYKETPKKFYVGEWHTHPNNSSIPSLTDIRAMNYIVENHNSFLSNPVLLIIGYSKINVDFGFYIWFENKLHKYE